MPITKEALLNEILNAGPDKSGKYALVKQYTNKATFKEYMAAFAELVKDERCPENLSIKIQGPVTPQQNAETLSDEVKPLTDAIATGKCKRGLSINFFMNNLRPRVHSAYQANQSGPFMEHMATMMVSRKAPENFTLGITGNALKSGDIEPLAKALESGKCKNGLTLNLNSNVIEGAGISRLCKAIQSGKCPENLTLIIGDNNIGSEGINALSETITSRQCPKGLTIKFSSLDVFNIPDIVRLCEALKSTSVAPDVFINLDENIMNSCKTHTSFRENFTNDLNKINERIIEVDKAIREEKYEDARTLFDSVYKDFSTIMSHVKSLKEFLGEEKFYRYFALSTYQPQYMFEQLLVQNTTIVEGAEGGFERRQTQKLAAFSEGVKSLHKIVYNEAEPAPSTPSELEKGKQPTGIREKISTFFSRNKQ